jgi:ABC-type transport system involved in cytochrome c biogenesis permease subunit
MMVIYLLIQLLKINDFIPVVIGTIPFLLVFFYLFMISDDIPEHSYFILIVQNMLISLVGGIAISSFIMKDSKRNSWLLLCGLLFVMLHLIIFIEKYYLSQLSPAVLRPIAMSVNVLAFYTFYEFVIAAERSDDNGAAVGGDAVAG